MAHAAKVEKAAEGPSRPDESHDDAEPRVLALDLVPLLAPHKKQGRLSIRIERLPQLARLSKGARNSDGSWSLTRDELEDLECTVPAGSDTSQPLAVRVISLANGNTLALVDVALAPAASAQALAAPAQRASADGVQTRRVQDELAALKVILAARESELAELRLQAGDDGAPALAPDPAGELAAARAALTAEADKRVAEAAVRAQAELQSARDTWQREARAALSDAEIAWKNAEAARFAAAEAVWRTQSEKALVAARADPARAAELTALHQKVSALQASLGDRDGALEQLRARAAREGAEALAAAERNWKEAEAARLGAAEAAWRAQSERMLAAAQQDSTAAAELAALNGKLAAAQAALSERDTALRQAATALAAAQSDWKQAEAARFAEAETQWRARAQQAVADAARDPARAAELAALRERLAALEAVLAERDQALSRAHEAAAEESARWQGRMQDALAKAEQTWKDGEAVRLVAAQTASQEKSTAALAAAHDEFEELRRAALRETQAALAKAEAAWKAAEAERFEAAEAEWRAATTRALADAQAAATASDPEREAAQRALREQVVELQGTLRQRERALAAADKAFEQERERWHREAHDAIMKAEKDFKAKEVSRRAAAEAQWRKESAGTLAHATARYEAAEAALAQIRIRSGAGPGRADAELGAVRASLEAREAELAQARATIERLRDDGATKVAPDGKRFLRDAMVAGAIGVAVVVAYPFVESWLSPPPPKPAPVVVVAPEPPPPPPVEKRATLSREGKLRAGPSNSTSVMATLASGASLVVLDERGAWVRVRVEGPYAKPGAREGWVSASLLKPVPAGITPASRSSSSGRRPSSP